MAQRKRKAKPYATGQVIRAELTEEQIALRNEIKLMLAYKTGRAYGRVSDNVLFGKAIEIYHQLLIQEEKDIIPEEWMEEYKAKEKHRKAQAKKKKGSP